MVEELDMIVFGCDAGKAGRYSYSPSEEIVSGIECIWPAQEKPCPGYLHRQ